MRTIIWALAASSLVPVAAGAQSNVEGRVGNDVTAANAAGGDRIVPQEPATTGNSFAP